ncbi:hypothetical protein D3C72_1844660 [compost metagenome]
MRAQLKGHSFFITPPCNYRNLKTHFTGVLNGHMAKSPHPENRHSVACPGTRITQRVEGSSAGAKDRCGMHRRKR